MLKGPQTLPDGVMGFWGVLAGGYLVGDLTVDGVGKTHALKAAELLYLCISLDPEYIEDGKHWWAVRCIVLYVLTCT